jgi:hypothetical protein
MAESHWCLSRARCRHSRRNCSISAGLGNKTAAHIPSEMLRPLRAAVLLRFEFRRSNRSFVRRVVWSWWCILGGSESCSEGGPCHPRPPSFLPSSALQACNASCIDKAESRKQHRMMTTTTTTTLMTMYVCRQQSKLANLNSLQHQDLLANPTINSLCGRLNANINHHPNHRLPWSSRNRGQDLFPKANFPWVPPRNHRQGPRT